MVETASQIWDLRFLLAVEDPWEDAVNRRIGEPDKGRSGSAIGNRKRGKSALSRQSLMGTGPFPNGENGTSGPSRARPSGPDLKGQQPGLSTGA